MSEYAVYINYIWIGGIVINTVVCLGVYLWGDHMHEGEEESLFLCWFILLGWPFLLVFAALGSLLILLPTLALSQLREAIQNWKRSKANE